MVDCFGNAESWRLVTDWCGAKGVPCLHIGLSADYAEVNWNEHYLVPGDGSTPVLDVCEYPLARNQILLSVAVGSEALVDYILKVDQRSLSITLRDLKIVPIEA